MSTDVTSLVLEVDSSQAKSATGDLQRLTKAGKTLEEQLGKEATAHDRVARAAEKAVRARDSKGRFIGAQRDYNRTLEDEIRHLGNSNRLLDSRTAIAKKLGIALGAATAAAAGFITYSVIKNTIEQEKATAQLEARIRSTGGAARLTKDQLIAMAGGLQQVTTYGDEAIMGAQGILLTFTKIGREVFPDALEQVLNMSTALGTDLNSASIQLGKALNDPIKGLTALSRAGVQFSKSQKTVIETLVKSGQVTEAQKIILKELEVQMGGSARAARETLGGAVEALKNNFGDLLEGDSGGDGVKGATQAINELTDLLGKPDTKQAFNDIIQLVFKLAGAMTAVTTESVSAFSNLQRWVNFQAGRALGFKGYDGGTDTAQMKYDAEKLMQQGRDKLQEASNLEMRTGGKHSYAEQLRREAKELFDTAKDIHQQRKAAYDIGLGNDEQFRAGVAAHRASYDPNPNGKTTGGGDDEASDAAKKAAEAARKRREREFQSLKDSLATEEEAIESSYRERERIIAESTKKGSEQQIELSRRSAAMRDKELQELREERGREIEELRLSLRTEEEAIQESYTRRLAIIDANTTLSDEARQKLRDKLAAERQQELQALADAEQQKRDQMMLGYMTEEQALILYHERRKQEILQATYLTEKERQELLRREEEAFMKESANRERQRISLMVNTSADLFGSLAQLMSAMSQQQGKEGKRAFEMSKKLAIAQTIMKTYESATSAYASLASIPYVGPALGAAAAAAAIAAGMANIANIRSQQYSGAYDQGGDIPAGKWGWVGENGPERVRGPVRVTGRKVSERYMGQGGGDVIQVTTNVHMAADGSATSTTSTSGGDAEQARQLGNMISAKVREELLVQMKDGGILSRSNRRN